MKCVSLSITVAILLASGVGFAAPAPPDAAAFFTEQVKPILEANCFKCHGGRPEIKGDFRITSRESLSETTSRGLAIDMERPAESAILQMISYRDEQHQMPPSGKLAQADIDTLTAWVNMGAPWHPAGADFGVEPAPEATGEAAGGADHWAYQPLTRPEVPLVGNPSWQTNPIDAFVKTKLDAAGLAPADPASRQVLIRRLYYDLIGLPPDPEAVERFIHDDDPQAYERLVDELLASPHYGERWARHWLDVVGYAETHGFERDADKPFMWRYRDYVINAFNQDKPYDQFVREQIAGDELPGAGPEQLIATGIYRLGIWDDEPADKLQGRYDELDGMVQTISGAFLGSTIGCARCHDHKIDPFPTTDYYSMVAFLQGVKSSQRTPELTNVMSAEEQAVYDAAVQAKEAEIEAIRHEIYDFERGYLAALKAKQPNEAPLRSDLVDLGYRFYRDTWERLPDFDTMRPEAEGKLPHNFVTLSAASRTDAIGLVFEGKIRAGTAGTYQFNINAKDGFRLTVNGQELYEQTAVGAMAGEATIDLEPGFHAFRVDYFHTYGEPVLDLRWSGPNFQDQALSLHNPPADALNVNQMIVEHGRDLLSEDKMTRYADLGTRLREVENRPVPGEYATAVTSIGPDVPDTHVLLRGNPHVEGEIVQPRFPGVLNPPEPVIPPPAEGAKSPGRRLALANWLASPENPLSARVMANRIWQYHFGRGIVRTSNDFGALGEMPTHPELLDWLASEFIAQDWSIRAMHRLILLSNTYRMSSQGNPQALAADPENNLFWRFDMRRLEAEEIRDSMLAVNDSINLEMGGPHVFPPMPEAVLATSSTPDRVWGISPVEDHTRRSIYTHVKRSLQDPLLADFDMADTEASCPVRFATTQPTQALNMLNSEFVNRQAEVLAAYVAATGAANLRTKIWLVLNRVTQRVPNDDEVDRGLAFVAEMREKFQYDEAKAFERFCLLALNLNEFVYID